MLRQAQQQEEEITYASRWLNVPVALDRGRFWGLSFARSGERIAYVTHDLGFCQMLESDLEGRDRRPLVSMDEGEVISEVHGYGAGDRYVVFSVQARGRHEIRVVEKDSRTAMTIAYESYFGGWDDANDAFFVWDRATGGRKVMRVKVDGTAKLVDAGHVDRRVVRSEDGRTVWFAQKFSDDVNDKRFTIYRSSERSERGGGARREAERRPSADESDESGERVAVAMIATTCRASRLKLTLSPGGAYLHVSALGTLEDGGEAVSFDLMIATDGSHRRLLPVKGWVAGDRALVQGRHKSLDLVDVRTGSRRALVSEAVDAFTISRDGERAAFLSSGVLQLLAIPE